MEPKNTAKTAASGIVWTLSERLCAQLVSLIVSVVLARMLTPDEYAIVGIVNIFIIISNVFVTEGFGNALIQKADADEIDFSTTLIFSTCFSLILCAVLFFVSPVVTHFYGEALLTPVLRVMSLKLIFSAINTVQHAYISKTMAFKKFFYSTFSGTVASAIVGIVMAYTGCGVWALVAQDLSNTIVHTIVLVFTCGWKPSLKYNAKRMKPLFSYGWKLLVSELLGTLYSQLQGLILSAYFAPSELSFYNQGEKYPALFIHNIEASLHKVMFPIISSVQQNLAKVKELTRKSLSLCFMLIAPCMFGLAACADTLIELLLTEKWLGCVPYLQIICFSYMLNPVMSAHTRMLKALGKSGIFMRICFVRYGSAFVLLLLVLFVIKNPYAVVAVSVVVMLIVCAVCGCVSKRILNYTFSEQISDLIRPFLIGLAMFVPVRYLRVLGLGLLPKLVVQVLAGIAIYGLLTIIFNRKQVQSCISLVDLYRRKRG